MFDLNVVQCVVIIVGCVVIEQGDGFDFFNLVFIGCVLCWCSDVIVIDWCLIQDDNIVLFVDGICWIDL